jgi:hypothetical protein
MIINNSNTTPMVGDLTGVANLGFNQMMTKLAETFDSGNTHLHYLKNIDVILEHSTLNESYKEVLLEDYTDAMSNLAESKGPGSDTAKQLHKLNYAKLQQLMENSREDLLNESQQTGSLLPMVGLTLPLLKLYWIKNVYKDIIPTVVSTQKDVKIGIEREYLMDQARVKHYLPDAFYNEGLDLFASARQKLTTADITVPSLNFDIITESGGSIMQDDTVSTQFFISSITYKKPVLDVDGTEKVDPAVPFTLAHLRIRVDQGTGMFKYPIHQEYTNTAGKKVSKIVDILQGDINFETGMLNLASTTQKITAITVDGYLSTENNARSMSVGWDKEIREFTIPDGEHLNTGLTEERIKDEKVIYNIDSATKVVQQMTNALGVLKDLKVKHFLDDSKERIKGTDLYIETTFDCKPPVTTLTPSEWINTELKRTLDRLSLKLAKVLQLEDIMFTVMGSQETVQLLDNVQWMYGKDSEVGGVKIGYNIGLYNNQRNFFIASSDRIKDDDLRIYIFPTAGNYMMYKLFEYQFCISNEYRTSENVRVPSVMAFDRYLIDELIPIQGSITIQHNEISSSQLYV